VTAPRRALSRLAYGTGLGQLRQVRQRVDRLAEDLDEHAGLQHRLADEVTRLEDRVAEVAVRRAEPR
jgi:hypothetical protein